MKNILTTLWEVFKSIFSNFLSIIYDAIIIVILPFIDVLRTIVKILTTSLNITFNINKKSILNVLDRCEKVLNISIVFYYIMLILLEISLTLSILNGTIKNYNFSELLVLTIFTILITIYIVNIINKKSNSKKFNIITYIQILYLLPLITAYWIASIEGHDIVLKNINADQWCNIFNSIIIYVSGCIIGFSNYLKTEK